MAGLNRRTLWIGLFSILFLIMLSTAAFASDFRFGKHFSDHTFIGPFNVSGLTEAEAIAKLTDNFVEMTEKAQVALLYVDTVVHVPVELLELNVRETVKQAQSGIDNPIKADVSVNGLSTLLVQQLPIIHPSTASIEKIAAAIEKEMETGIMPVAVQVIDYLEETELPLSEIYSFNFPVDRVSQQLNNAFDRIDGLEVGPFETISMMEVLDGIELSDDEMSILSSVVYQAVLQTNFTILERHTRSSLTPFVEGGFEAAMNQSLGLDFTFENPNKTSYRFRTDKMSDSIKITINGPAFYYSYVPYISEFTSYKPRSVKQFSAFVNEGHTVVANEGREGAEFVVDRNIILNDEVVRTEHVSKDYYPPVPRIELHPLTNKTASTSLSQELQNQGEDREGANTNQNEMNGKLMENNDSSSNRNMNSPENEIIEGQAIYDKSGLPIKGK